MARVLPRRPAGVRRTRPQRRQRPMRAPTTVAEDVLMGLNIARGGLGVVKGVGDLAYEGGIPAAISDAYSGGPPERERIDARRRIAAEYDRPVDSGLGLTPEGRDVGLMPVYGADPGSALQRQASLLGAHAARAGATADFGAMDRAAPQGWQPQPQEVTVKNFPISGTARHKGLDKVTGLTQAQREKTHPMAIAGRTYTYPAPTAATAQPTAKDATPDNPRTTSRKEVSATLERAREGGGEDAVEQTKEIIKVRLANGSFKLISDDAHDEQRDYAANVEGLQAKYDKELEEAEGFGAPPVEFRQIAGRVGKAESERELDMLQEYALAIAPKPGWREQRAGLKSKELENVETLIRNRRTQIEGRPGMPLFDPTKYSQLGAAADIAKIRARRMRFWEGSGDAPPRGPRPVNLKDSLASLASLKRTLDTRLTNWSDDPSKKAQAAIGGVDLKIGTLDSQLATHGINGLARDMASGNANELAEAAQANMPTPKTITAFRKAAEERLSAVSAAANAGMQLDLKAKVFATGLILPAVKVHPATRDDDHKEASRALHAAVKAIPKPKKINTIKGDIGKLAALVDKRKGLSVKGMTQKQTSALRDKAIALLREIRAHNKRVPAAKVQGYDDSIRTLLNEAGNN